MGKLQNNFTTPKQSKLLLQLGVPAESADCIFTRFSRDEKWKRRFIEDIVSTQLFCNLDFYLPCWSVGRLMEIFDKCKTERTDCYRDWAEYTACGNYVQYIISAFSRWDGTFDFSKLEE